MIEITRSQLLGAVPHGFLGRRGGVSTGIASGLNVGLGSGDDEAAVRENRKRAANAILPGADLVGLYQIHSPDVVIVETPWDDDHRPQADALVTARPGTLLGIVTADCAPVLLVDADARIIAAAHAGWKGARGGVIENTVIAMEQLGAKREQIASAIGPCIAQASYEVGADFKAQFERGDERFFAPGKPGHFHFDLEAYVASRLAAAEIRRIDRLGLDTYPDEYRFFSYRRATHRGDAAYGRQFSLIGLPISNG